MAQSYFRSILPSIAGILIVIGSLIVAYSFWRGQKTSSFKTAPASLYVVNVLDADLYNDAHIKGSINITLQELEAKAKAWDHETPVVFYCSNYMCSGSGQAAKMLTALGFKDVRAYEGGTAEWYQLSKTDPSYIIEGPAQQRYLSIVMEKPSHEEEAGVRIITAPELKKMMKDANIL